MDPVCVYSTNDQTEALQVKDLLETSGIAVLVKNLLTQNLFGGLKPFAGYDAVAGSIQFFVSPTDEEAALGLLASLFGEEVPPADGDLPPELPDEVPPRDPAADERYEEKRVLFVANFLAALSFLLIPVLLNIPNLIFLFRRRRRIFWMMTAETIILAGVSLFALVFNGGRR